MNVEFWFNIIDDYRSGYHISTYTKPPNINNENNEINNDTDDDIDDDINDEDYETPWEACNISFSVPQNGIRIFIVNDYPDYKPIWHIDATEETDHNKIYLKIFSQLHDCLPFKVTGYNGAYKELGYYPEIPDDIKEMKLYDIPKQMETDTDGIYFYFVLDSDGNEITTKLLVPAS